MKTLYRKSASLDSPVLLVIKDMDNQVRPVPLTEEREDFNVAQAIDPEVYFELLIFLYPPSEC